MEEGHQSSRVILVLTAFGATTVMTGDGQRWGQFAAHLLAVRASVVVLIIRMWQAYALAHACKTGYFPGLMEMIDV